MQALRERLQSAPKDVADILRALFLPKRYANDFRLASEGAGLPSAVANMSLSYNTGDWDTTTVGTLLPAADYMLFLFANPLRAFIQYVPNPSGQTYTYLLADRDGQNSFAIPLYEERKIYARHATGQSAFLPHGSAMFPGYDDGAHNYYLWVNQADGDDTTGAGTVGMSVTLNVAPTFTAGTRIRFYAWDGKHAQLLQTTDGVIGRATYWLNATALPASGAYIFCSVTNLEAPITSAVVTIIGNSSCWGHRSISQIASLLDQAYGIRVNACSVRVQNDASPLSRNGNTTAVTVSKSLPWTNFATSASALSTLQNYREFTADKGYYGVPLPDSDDDVSEFYDDICHSSLRAVTFLPQFSYPLSERRPYKAVSFNIPVSAGRSLTFDVTHAIEYLTNNKLQEQKPASVSQESVCAAIVIASTQETDYENTANWRDALETVAEYMDHNAAARRGIQA
jgi:hypothetical protein